MAITKVHKFEKKQIRAAELAKALGHPARIAILQMLSRCDGCICGDITDELPLAQSTVSQHLKVLREAKLIEGAVEGVRICYCINGETGKEIKKLLGEFIDTIQPKFDC